jgi:predicted DCC family thiol-disulfide oxidoreductase YuxK
VLHILRRLGGAWPALGGAARIVPRPVRDAVYDLVARYRRRFFAEPADACPMLPPELRSRFSA